jgi:hypothetical protein
MKITLRKLLNDYNQLSPPTKDTWRAHAIWHTMTAHCKNANKWAEVFGIRSVQDGGNEQEVEVKVTINGVQVPFESFMDHVSSQSDDMVRAAARQMFDERLFSNDSAHQERAEHARVLGFSDDR